MNADSFPTFRAWGRFLRRCLRRVPLIFFSRKSLAVYLVIFSLGTLAWFADRWHGRRAWEAEKARLTAAGETLDLKALLAPRPPDAENFCAIPELNALRLDRTESERELLRDRLFMWYNKDTVEKRTPSGKVFRSKAEIPHADADSSLAEICTVFRKTGALPPQPLAGNPAEELMQSAAEWEEMLAAMDKGTSRKMAVLIPAPAERAAEWQQWSYSRIYRLVRCLTLHGLAALETGNIPMAHRDLRISERLAEAIQNEKSFFGLFAAEAMRRQSDQVVRSGIRRHQWSEPDLERFINVREEKALAEAWFTGTQTCRAWLCSVLEHPAGKLDAMVAGNTEIPWMKTLRIAILGFYLKCAPEGPGLRYCTEVSQFYSRLGLELCTRVQGESLLSRIRKIEGYPAVFGPRFTEGSARACGNPLFGRRLLRGACILEQYFLKDKRYPANLDAVFTVSPETFTDVDGRPLHYRTNAEGTNFRLWSVGWDGNDDSASTAPLRKGEDWVFSTEQAVR